MVDWNKHPRDDAVPPDEPAQAAPPPSRYPPPPGYQPQPYGVPPPSPGYQPVGTAFRRHRDISRGQRTAAAAGEAGSS